MMDKKNHFSISEMSTIKEALQQLNKGLSRSMTLFVINNQKEMVGTITDGDIRRALIQGKVTEDFLYTVMHRDFCYLNETIDIKKLINFRNRNLTLVPILNSEKSIIDVLDFTVQKSLLPIDAVLMAGGRGERLRPLTLTTPKPLLKIGDKPIIDYNVDNLIDFGVKNIYITVNYLKELIIDHYSRKETKDSTITCVAEEKFLGTIGSLRLINEFSNDTILVMNSDLITNINLEDFYCHFKENDALMSAAAVPYSVNIPYGIFSLEGRNITGVKEKPVYDYYANAGIYLISKKALKYIPENKEFNATDLIDALIRDNQRVIRFPLTGMWIDVGTPQEFERAKDFIKHLF